MSVQPDVDWDIEEDLTNKKRHYAKDLTGEGPLAPGTLFQALCGAVVRARGGYYLNGGPSDPCPDCRANDPYLKH